MTVGDGRFRHLGIALLAVIALGLAVAPWVVEALAAPVPDRAAAGWSAGDPNNLVFTWAPLVLLGAAAAVGVLAARELRRGLEQRRSARSQLARR